MIWEECKWMDMVISILLMPRAWRKGVHAKKDHCYFYLHAMLRRPIKGRGKVIARGRILGSRQTTLLQFWVGLRCEWQEATWPWLLGGYTEAQGFPSEASLKNFPLPIILFFLNFVSSHSSPSSRHPFFSFHDFGLITSSNKKGILSFNLINSCSHFIVWTPKNKNLVTIVLILHLFTSRKYLVVFVKWVYV